MKRRLSEYACKRKVKHCRVASWKCGDAFPRHARSREQLKAGAQFEPPRFSPPRFSPPISTIIQINSSFCQHNRNSLPSSSSSSISQHRSLLTLHSSGDIVPGTISIIIHRSLPDIQIPSSAYHQLSLFLNRTIILKRISSWQSECGPSCWQSF